MRLPRRRCLKTWLAVLSFVGGSTAEADIIQIDISGILNVDLNRPQFYDGDFRTGIVAAPGGLTFNIPTVGNDAWSSAIGAPLFDPVSSGPITVNVAGVTTVYALINSFGGLVGSTATVLFHGSSSDVTATITAGTDFRDFNNDGFANITTSPQHSARLRHAPGWGAERAAATPTGYDHVQTALRVPDADAEVDHRDGHGIRVDHPGSHHPGPHVPRLPGRPRRPERRARARPADSRGRVHAGGQTLRSQTQEAPSGSMRKMSRFLWPVHEGLMPVGYVVVRDSLTVGES
jgi:hypothetical protein